VSKRGTSHTTLRSPGSAFLRLSTFQILIASHLALPGEPDGRFLCSRRRGSANTTRPRQRAHGYVHRSLPPPLLAQSPGRPLTHATARSDARWYTRAEILEVLEHKLGTTFGAADRKRLAEAGNSAGHEKISAEVKPAEPVVDEPPFRVPPTSAIAGVLIREWAYKKIQFPPAGVAVQKGNL
jgi:hypothetical protein